MERVFPNCAGLDIHKKLIVACRLTTDERGQTQKAVRKFGTLTAELEALAAWLAAGGCTHVAMESTGVYWRPIYNILQEHVEVWVVNAHHVKHVPGRKTDVKDAEWLAQLLQQGLLRPSFIPSREQRELRDVVRQRQALVEDRTRVVNRLQKVLEDANLKLASVVGDLQGVSAQAILRALLGGEEEPRALADLARGRLRKKRADLERALVGRLREHHRFMLLHLLAQLDFLDEEITLLDAHIDALIAGQPEVAAAVERLDSIPGVSRLTAIVLVAEIGADVSRFPTARHLAAWAGLAPGNRETGGTPRAAGTRKGNRYLRRCLVQAALAAARTKGSYLKALYHRLAARRGKRRAAVAVARSLLEIAYYLLRRGEWYRELGAEYFDRLDRERTGARLVQRLRRLGFVVTLTEPAPVPAGVTASP
jgi:transposase